MTSFLEFLKYWYQEASVSKIILLTKLCCGAGGGGEGGYPVNGLSVWEMAGG